MNQVTWPPAVLKFAAAIKVAEGSNPAWNNPGDLTYSMGFPVLGVVNSEGVLHFVNLADGEYVLNHQCYLMLSGRSHIYQLSWSLARTGVKYSGGNANWALNVSRELGVPVATTLAQIAMMS
jgi:hypothetical protein